MWRGFEAGTESIELMHHKQDRAGQSMASRSKVVDTAKARLDNLEEVAHSHNVAHKAAIARMDELERELQVLKARTSRAIEPGARGRSPTPPLMGERDRSPAGSRSPRDGEAEFQVVMGGCRDARKTEAEEEAKKLKRYFPLLNALGLPMIAGLRTVALLSSRSHCTILITPRPFLRNEPGR